MNPFQKKNSTEGTRMNSKRLEAATTKAGREGSDNRQSINEGAAPTPA